MMEQAVADGLITEDEAWGLGYLDRIALIAQRRVERERETAVATTQNAHEQQQRERREAREQAHAEAIRVRIRTLAADGISRADLTRHLRIPAQELDILLRRMQAAEEVLVLHGVSGGGRPPTSIKTVSRDSEA